MQRTMLADKRAAVHAHDIILRECFLQGPPGFHVLVRLIISRIKHGCVGYQKISVGGGQTFTIFIVNRIGQRNADKAIRLIACGAESLQLRFHQLQFGIMLIGGIVAFHINYRVIRTKTGQRINV